MFRTSLELFWNLMEFYIHESDSLGAARRDREHHSAVFSSEAPLLPQL